jgi:hypothetical protein
MLTSCATPAANDYSVIADDLILVPLEYKAGDAVVEVRRHPGMLGAAMKVVLSVDGRDVAQFKAAKKLSFTLPAGEHRFGVRWSHDSESFSTMRLVVTGGQQIRLGITVATPPAFFGRAQPAISEM